MTSKAALLKLGGWGILLSNKDKPAGKMPQRAVHKKVVCSLWLGYGKDFIPAAESVPALAKASDRSRGASRAFFGPQ